MMEFMLFLILYFQAVAPSQQTGTIIGHLTQGSASTAVSTPVVARAVEGGRVAGVAVSDQTGGYRLSVPPGRYVIAAGLLDSPTYYPRVIDSNDAKPVKVLAGTTVAGIDFALVNPVDIPVRGRVIVEGGESLPLDVAGFIGSALPANSVPATPALMRMIAQQIAGGARSSVTVRADGTFGLALPPGGNQVLVQALPVGYYVKSITAGGVDILQSPFIVVEGAPEILVTLTRTAPSYNPPTVTLSGRVSDLPADTSSQWVILQSSLGSPGVPSTIAEIAIQPDGTFQRSGVPPGNYTISTAQPGQRRPIVVPLEGIGGIELAYAPPRPARGAPSYPSTPSVTVRGRVDAIPGTTMPESVRLTSSAPRREPKSSAVNSDGSFVFTQVLSGRYELRVGVEPLSVARSVSVGNQEVSGLEIKAAVEARGRVAMADGNKLPPILFQIQGQYAAGQAGNARAMETIQREFDPRDDGTFTLGVVRGEQRISVVGLPASYSVKSITYGSTDLLVQPLVLNSSPTSEILVTLEATSIPAPNFRFVYEIGHDSFLQPNSIDSARGTYTKDMVEEPPRTFNLRLTDGELDQIEKKLDDIDFWNSQKYPPVFTMPNPSSLGCSSTGRQPIYLFVVRGGITKELTWMDQDSICGAPNPAGADLRSFMKLMRDILDAKPEYRNLPKPRGMYID